MANDEETKTEEPEEEVKSEESKVEEPKEETSE